MNGRILGIKIGDTFVPCEMSCDISIDGERINTSSSENGNWRNSIAGYRSWKASVNGKFQLDASEGSEAGSLGLIQAIIDGTNVELVMTLRIDSTQSLLIGGIAGTTNISISAGSTGDATWSGAFDGVGLLDLDYNFGAGYLRDNDGDKIVDSEGFGILLAGGDINFPNGVSRVSPSGTKILVADTNDEIAWINPYDISENSYTTAEKNKLASMTAIFTTALKTAYDGAVTWISTNGAALIAHLTRTDNPHSVTKAQVGLGNVSNVASADLPISSATQTALDAKLSDITGLIEQGTNVTISGSGTDTDPYIISSSGGGGGGGVSSVGLTAPTGFSVSNTPITSSGNIALAFATGYSLPTNTKQTSWDAKQDALGFTPENVTNKATDLTSPNNTKYPTVRATVNGLATKAPIREDIVSVTANKTFALTDENTFQDVTATANLTVPLNSVVAFPIGTEIEGAIRDTITGTFIATGGVTIINKSLTVAGLTAFTLKKVDTDTWLLTTNASSGGGTTILFGTTTMDTSVFIAGYKDVTVTGANLLDIVTITDNVRISGNLYWISGKVISTNTVRIYVSYYSFNPGSSDVTFTPSSAATAGALPWSIDFSVIKKT